MSVVPRNHTSHAPFIKSPFRWKVVAVRNGSLVSVADYETNWVNRWMGARDMFKGRYASHVFGFHTFVTRADARVVKKLYEVAGPSHVYKVIKVKVSDLVMSGYHVPNGWKIPSNFRVEMWKRARLA